MVDQARLTQIFKDFYEISGEIPAAFALNQGNGANSLGRARLSAFLRKHHMPSVNLNAVKTWEELCQQMLGAPVLTQKNNRIEMTPLKFGSIGIDIELIARFPVVNDYWTDLFYQSHFSVAEIAYCVSQDKPTESFAGKWCIKEALLKCFNDLQGVALSDIEIVRQENDQLVAFKKDQEKKYRIPAALSLSHSHDYAIGVAVVSSEQTPIILEDIKTQKIPSMQMDTLINSVKRWKRLTIFAIVIAILSEGVKWSLFEHIHF